jgi:hypothetical protein
VCRRYPPQRWRVSIEGHRRDRFEARRQSQGSRWKIKGDSSGALAIAVVWLDQPGLAPRNPPAAGPWPQIFQLERRIRHLHPLPVCHCGIPTLSRPQSWPVLYAANTFRNGMGEPVARVGRAEMKVRRREQQRPSTITPVQPQVIQRLGSDIRQVWRAPMTTDRDLKELLRTVLVVFQIRCRVE